MEILPIPSITDISIGKIVSVETETINGNWKHTWSKPLHFYKLTYVLKGSYITNCNGTRFTARENDILFCHTYNFSSASTSKIFSYIGIYFTVSDIDSCDDFFFNEARLFKNRGHLRNLFQAMHNEFHSSDFRNKLTEKRLLYEILENCCMQNKNGKRIPNERYPIKKAVEAIENEYATDLTVEYLAELCNYTPAHFISLFRKTFNTTPKNYIISKRMEKAKELLLSTNAPILTVAENVGYSTSAHFSAEFKRHTGFSPLNFRKNYAFTVIP